MATINVRGIVIRSVDYGETSKILTVFSQELGIISVMARGVKSAKSKKQNLVVPFTEINFELNESKNFYYLSDGEIINANLGIRSKLIDIYLGQLFFDIIENTIIKENQSSQEYLLLSKSLKFLSENKDNNHSLTIANMFLIKYISMIGYKPNLVECSICKASKFKQLSFAHNYGGIICQKHNDIGAESLSEKEYRYLCNIMVQVFENIGIISEGIDEKKIFKLLFEFIIYNIDMNVPKSLQMVYKILGIN